MLKSLVKTDWLVLGGQSCPVHYFAARTGRGGRRYSAEVVLGPDDHIIVDDDSLGTLEASVARLVPAMVYSRQLAGRATAA